MEDFLSQDIPDVTISQVRAMNVRDFNKPFILVVTFASPRLFRQEYRRNQRALSECVGTQPDAASEGP